MWWCKARRVHSVLPITFAVFVVLSAVIQDGSAVLPSFSSGLDPVPLMLFVPMSLVVGLMLCLESRLDAAEVAGTRPVLLLDAALALGVVALATGVGFAVEGLLGSAHAAAGGRNTAFLTGLMLVTRAFAGQPAVMAPVAWLIAVLLFGFTAGNEPRSWTVLPEDPRSVHAALTAGAALAAGLTAMLLAPRKPT